MATVTMLETEHGIMVTAPTGMTRRSTTSESVSVIGQFQRSVAIPYIDLLLENIQNCFFDKAVEILVATSILSLSLFPLPDSLSSYGEKDIGVLADFYGQEIEVEYDGNVYTSSPLLNADELISEWQIFRRAVVKERK